MKNKHVCDFLRRFKTALFALAMFVIFALIIYFTKDIKLLVVNTTVDARFWPKMIGIAGCFLCVLLLIQGVMEGVALRRKEETGLTPKPPRGEKFYEGGKLRVGVTLLLMFLYILGLDFFGFVATTVLYLFCQFLTFSSGKKRSPWKLALIAAVFTAVIFVLFRYAFQMMLPMGKCWEGMGGLFS